MISVCAVGTVFSAVRFLGEPRPFSSTKIAALRLCIWIFSALPPFVCAKCAVQVCTSPASCLCLCNKDNHQRPSFVTKRMPRLRPPFRCLPEYIYIDVYICGRDITCFRPGDGENNREQWHRADTTAWPIRVRPIRARPIRARPRRARPMRVLRIRARPIRAWPTRP